MNNKRLVLGASGAVVLALLVLFGAWFWSLGSVRASELPTVRIEALHAPVEWRRASDEGWQTLTVPVDVLPGDRIRTGEGGEARIVWGERGVTRIDEKSEVTVEASPLDGLPTPGAKIRLRIEGGRVWSRMLKLLDLESAMEIKTSDVVATVRGTTFGVGKSADGMQIAVTESVVSVAGTKAATLVRDNQWGDLDAAGGVRELRDLRPEDAWAMENERKDAEEDRQIFGAWRNRLEIEATQNEGIPPGFVYASEVLRLRLSTGIVRERLATAYASRRLARALTGHDARDWDLFRLYAAQAGGGRPALLAAAHVAASMRSRGTAGNASVPRDLRSVLIEPGAARQAYLETVAIDDRIDDWLATEPARRSPDSVKDLRNAVEVFDGGIDRLYVTSDEKSGLHRRAEALRKRLDYLATLEATPVVPVDVPQPVQGTQIPDTAKPQPSVLKPAYKATSLPSYQRLVLLADVIQPLVGQKVKLTLFGVTAAGQTDDLTARALFSAGRSGDGYFSGNIFTPVVAGSMTLNARFTDNSGTRTASTVITARASSQPVTGLKSISIQFTGPTTLACSGRAPFKIFALDENGSSKDVTLLSAFAVSNPNLIFASDGAVLSFCAAKLSTATLTATYTENKVTRTASAVITVDPGAPPATGGCTGRNCP